MVGTNGDNVEGVVTDSADLSVFVVHEIDEVRRRLSLTDDHFACRLVKYHLVEHVDDL